jgi:predicted metal-binding transcription factor (methanogenesis marker protein 9)
MLNLREVLGSEPPFADEVCADSDMTATANFCCLQSKQQVVHRHLKETKKETKE